MNLRATGIARRMDYINRVVLPKSFLREIGVEPGSEAMMEFFISDEGYICIKPLQQENPSIPGEKIIL